MHDDLPLPGSGHNSVRPLQWQKPHLESDHHHHDHEEPASDFDLVESAFIEGFETSADPTSFLRLAGVPFKTNIDGKVYELIRVEIRRQIDVASVTPLLGGGGHRVAPLPASHVGKRHRLGFVYLGENDSAELSLKEAKSLPEKA